MPTNMLRRIMAIVLVAIFALTIGISTSLLNRDNGGDFSSYPKVTQITSQKMWDKALFMFDDTVWYESTAEINFLKDGAEPLGKITSLIPAELIPQQNGETNSKQLAGALVYDKTEKSIVVNYNGKYILYYKAN